MNINQVIINRMKESSEFQNFLKNPEHEVSGLKGGSEALFFATLLKEVNKSILIIKETEEEAFALAQNIAFYNVESYSFPDYDIIPFTEMSPITDIMHERIKVLYKSTLEKSIIVVLSAKSLLRLLPNKDTFNEYILELTVGMKIDLEYLRLFLHDLGYVHTREVLEKGVITTRGSIFDIFSPIYDNPVRIEFFDDEIESIRHFSIEDGKSFQSINSFTIVPIRECIFDDETLQNVLESENNIDAIIKEKLEHSKYFAGSENLLSIFNESLHTIFDYYENAIVFVKDKTQVNTAFSNYIDSINYSFENPDNIFKCIENYNNLYIDNKTFSNTLNSSTNISSFKTPDTKSIFDFKEGLSFKTRLTEFLEYIKEHLSLDYFIILTTSHDEQASRFYKLTEDLSPTLILENDKTKNENANANFIITNSKSNLGFTSLNIKVLFITDNEVFGRKRKKHLRIPKANKSLIETFVDLNVGDYAVHVNYGIGLYLGLTRKSSGGKEKDYITLEYAKGDKLYIPVEQMNFVQKYISGSGGSGPALTHLGGSSWDKVKTKAKADAQAMALELVKLYAIRSKIVGTIYEKDTQWQDDFEASFMYEETPDQLRAVSEIKADMESEKMMDRLVCGDVGFGKTEVAFRAIFKAIMSGKQVAILCPTTILSQQHFENSKKRFKDFPIKIGLLNRFVTTKDVKKTKERVKDGSIDLIIGTHKLLASDVEFKNLMLIVVDEEQRFGVKHKEALKKLKLEADVLTLSATPIPRTLNMALSGIRDISIIETPPLNRVPVKTFVTEFNETAVETAISRELDRGGQVFFLYNRIDTIDSFAVLVKGICKKARIGIAHGRLTGHQLETIMKDFIDHKYDILISTTIIENGIDIPNANTILIDNAHKLGLSELYQLRGRVGRSDTEAYAYLFYPPNLSLSEIAYKRLEAISEHTDLGSGFKIAMKDLEIRGAGSILGKEQSGTIYQVGYELYTQMLEEAANQYKGEIKEVTFDTVIDFKHNLYIPDTYIDDPKEKISAYKIIMRSQNIEDIKNTSEYIEDKYGKMPNEVSEIFEIAKLKTVLRDMKVLSVIEGNYNIYIKLNEYSKIDGAKIAALINKKGSGLYLDKTNFNQLIVPMVEDTLEWKIERVREVLMKIEDTEIKEKENDKKISIVDLNIKEINKNSKRKNARLMVVKKRRD